MYTFSTTHRVRLFDTDHFEVMYFGNYFRLFEKGIIETYRAAGMGWDWFRENGIMFYVASVSCDYRKPVRLDDVLEIRVTIKEIGNSSIPYHIDVFRVHKSGFHLVDTGDSKGGEEVHGKREENGARRELVAMGGFVHVFLGRDGRPERVPDIIREKLST